MAHRCQMAPKTMCSAKGTLNVGYYTPMGGARFCSGGVREVTSSPRQEFEPIETSKQDPLNCIRPRKGRQSAVF